MDSTDMGRGRAAGAKDPVVSLGIQEGSVIGTRFWQAVLREGLPHTSRVSWPCEKLTPFGHVLASHRLGEGIVAVIARVRGALAWMLHQGGELVLHVAAPTVEVGASVIAEARATMPELEAREESVEAVVDFWSGGYADPIPRRLDVVEWSSVAENYPQPTRGELDELMGWEGPSADGGLMLWHGEPGTGKTFALRALAWEWRDWCDVDYVVDPDALLGSSTRYLMNVLLAGTEESRTDGDYFPSAGSRWRLIVLEDAGELVRADAKAAMGQALSRLLNVADGLVGQGLKLLFLITTNDDIRKLHPATTRYGRCLSQVEFRRFDEDASAAWLRHRGIEQGRGILSLAELYAVASGQAVDSERRVGFAG